MAELKPWWEVAQPRKDIREGRFDESLFAADLGLVLAGKGPLDYRDPVVFFKRTCLTRGLRSMLLDILSRLAGKGKGEPVIQLQTPFGGGKTHTLLALYHLIESGDEVSHLGSVRQLLKGGKFSKIPKTNVVVLVGNALDPTKGRRTKDGIHIYTLWGELAYQLGGKKLYDRVKENDKVRVPPGTNLLSEILEEAAPCLVLVDEILEYVVRASGIKVEKETLAGQTLSFLDELCRSVMSHPRVAMVATLPSSHLERYGPSAEEAFHRLSRIFGRVERVRTPIEGEEIYDVLKLRLFEDVGNVAYRKKVAETYREFYQAQSEELPRKVKDPEYRRLIEKAFPFHPELISILHERWGALPQFQRTRGVLRLLARVVEDLYKNRSKGPLIQPCDVNLANPDIRVEFVKFIGNEWESVIASDIAGSDAKSPRIDRELGSEYAREQVAQGLAASVFLYSHATREPGGTEAQLRLAVLRPKLTPAIIADVLNKFDRRLFFFYKEAGVYRFKTVPNLTKIIIDREDGIREEGILKLAQRTLGDIVGEHRFRVYHYPADSMDVMDVPEPSLVLLDLDHTKGPSTWDDTLTFISEVLNRHGKAFRKYKNVLAFLVPDESGRQRIIEAGRMLLALRMVEEEYRGREELTEDQRKGLKARLEDAESRLPQTLATAYNHIVFGGPDGEIKSIDMGAQVYTARRSISEVVWSVLNTEEKLLDRLDPSLIRGPKWKLWPEDKSALNVKELRDYFARYTHLPMLEGDKVFTESIARGVERGLFGLGFGDGEKYDKVYYGEQVSPEAVEISENSWLIKPEKVQELTLKPVKPGEAWPPTPGPPGVGPPTEEKLEVGPPGRRFPEVTVRAYLDRFDKWRDFYGGVINPLVQEGADVKIQIELKAKSDAGISENTLELKVKESLAQLDPKHEIITKAKKLKKRKHKKKI